MANALPAGWAKPANSRKYHYFPASETMALCHRWMFAGEYREDEYDEHPENCTACRKLVIKHRNMSADAKRA